MEEEPTCTHEKSCDDQTKGYQISNPLTGKISDQWYHKKNWNECRLTEMDMQAGDKQATNREEKHWDETSYQYTETPTPDKNENESCARRRFSMTMVRSNQTTVTGRDKGLFSGMKTLGLGKKWEDWLDLGFLTFQFFLTFNYQNAPHPFNP